MTKFLAPVLVALPLLGTQVAIASEGCGFGYFRDGNGNCLYYGNLDGREACPPGRHFQQSSNYPQGRCLLNHY
jgi:hypothetical protein